MEITVIAKTVTADGDEDIFGPYNTIQDIVLVQYVIHKYLGNHIRVDYCARNDGRGSDGEYVLNYVNNNDEIKEKLESILESFNDLPHKYNYAYEFLKNHHLKISIKK